MPAISDIHYCTQCRHKMIWECAIRLRTYPYDMYSMQEDTYKPRLLQYSGGIAKLEFTCKNCKQVDIVNYNVYNSHTD